MPDTFEHQSSPGLTKDRTEELAREKAKILNPPTGDEEDRKKYAFHFEGHELRVNITEGMRQAAESMLNYYPKWHEGRGIRHSRNRAATDESVERRIYDDAVMHFKQAFLDAHTDNRRLDRVVAPYYEPILNGYIAGLAKARGLAKEETPQVSFREIGGRGRD